ncbi:MAG: hypothetical protein AB7O98_03985 [Hyphomonadaceae bacterium]
MKPFALQADRSVDAWAPQQDGGEGADYCSRDGALALKLKIEAYWRERGHDVMVALHNVGFHPAIRAARFDVRSDMVNGLPRLNGKPAAAHAKAEDVYVDDFSGDDDVDFE